MSYVDYSTNFILDQFFTYLNANQLGANDEHLYDTIAVEHNINTSTADGTHKPNSILGSYINTTPISTGSQAIAGGGSWTPTVGVYQIVTSPTAIEHTTLEIYVSGSWRSGAEAAMSSQNGIIFCDGTNMRISAVSAWSVTVWYQKF